MPKLSTFLKDYMTGDAWEELCVKCYRDRYQKEHYTEIPAGHGGDAGIEGFTVTGVVHQCYCPEKNYSDDHLYEKQRDKLTTDIDKLKKNAVRLKKLGVTNITEWHFNTPEYRDSRIVAHASTKQSEILKTKEDDPLTYSHIADDFKIVIKTAKDFMPEISRIIRMPISDYRLNLAVEHEPLVDWSLCESEKVENVKRKLKSVTGLEDDDSSFIELVGLYLHYYLVGIENIETLRTFSPEIYEELYKIEQSYKNEMRIKSLLNSGNIVGRKIFTEILDGFEIQLKQSFSDYLSPPSIFEIKQDLVASWLADCSLSYINK